MIIIIIIIIIIIRKLQEINVSQDNIDEITTLENLEEL